MVEFEGRLMMAYRYHRTPDDPRSAIALVELSRTTYQPIAKSEPLELEQIMGDEHQEDPRLFVFDKRLHISYTEMTNYLPGEDYNCVIKYAELKRSKGRWKIGFTWQPDYGENHNSSKEKNWVFFEQDNRLFCIYCSSPRHTVIELQGGKVVEEYTTPAPAWPWGIIRGGAPPIKIGGKMVHVFHSSLPTEIPPHYVRYYAGLYTFEARPPFAPINISRRPLMVGSEMDGHRQDPRYAKGWKPFVVFPCGVFYDGGLDKEAALRVSLGVNDWHIAIAPIKWSGIEMIDADGASRQPRYFRSHRGNYPEPITSIGPSGAAQNYIQFEVPERKYGTPPIGYFECRDEQVADELAEIKHIEEISEETYQRALTLARR